MKFTKQTLAVLAVLFVAVVLGLLILKTPKPVPADEHGHGEQEHADHADEKAKAKPATATDAHDHEPAAEKDAHGHEHSSSEAGHQEGDGHDHANEAHAAHESHGGDHVEMDDAKVKASKIGLVQAGPAELAGETVLPGEVRINEDRQSHVTPRLEGVAVQVLKTTGAAVKKGETLAIIESQALAELRSQHLVAAKRAELAKSTYEREKKLWEGKISPEQDYLTAKNEWSAAQIETRALNERLQALGASTKSSGSLARYEIRSPQTGLVIEKHVSPGESVKEESDLFLIADLSTVWAELTISPKHLAQIRQGQAVRVISPDLNTSVNGTISYISSLIGEQTRTAKARVVVPNPDGRWRPGLFVSIAVAEGRQMVPVAIPASAVQTLENREVVFVREGDAFEARPVKLGRKSGPMIEVLDGLKAGDVVATENSFILKAEIGKASAEHEH